MSGIVLSAAVRQNLLSLQSTAELLSTTQNRLATGKKVNTALDNPTNYFTAQGLDNRASDISNLLDGIGNGVQVLQAANTGLTSLQKLVDTAKSIANQVLQAPAGYSWANNRRVPAAPAGRYREIDRQPGAAGTRRLFAQVDGYLGSSPHRQFRQPGRRHHHQGRRRSDNRFHRRWNGDQHHLRRQRVPRPAERCFGGQQPVRQPRQR